MMALPNRPLLILLAFAGIVFLIAIASNSGSHTFSTSFQRLSSQIFSVDPHLQAKLAHAEKLWMQTVEDRQRMKQESGNRKWPDDYIYPYNVWDFERPSFFCPHDLERVGSLGDGGKVVCGMTRYERESPGPSSDSNTAQDFIVYSFGVNDDSSFEAALLERTNARIWGYDYTVNKWAKEIKPEYATRATFKKAGIGRTDESKNPPFYTVQDLMKANGHTYVDLVKMDIEGAEYDAMTSLVNHVIGTQGANGTLPFGQLLIEIHLMDPPPGVTIPQNVDQWLAWWASLEKLGLRPVNNEDNWIGDNIFGKPRFMEYTMINVLDHDRNKLLWA